MEALRKKEIGHDVLGLALGSSRYAEHTGTLHTNQVLGGYQLLKQVSTRVFFKFVKSVSWGTCPRELSQVLVEVRGENGQILSFILYSGDLLEPII